MRDDSNNGCESNETIISSALFQSQGIAWPTAKRNSQIDGRTSGRMFASSEFDPFLRRSCTGLPTANTDRLKNKFES